MWAMSQMPAPTAFPPSAQVLATSHGLARLWAWLTRPRGVRGNKPGPAPAARVARADKAAAPARKPATPQERQPWKDALLALGLVLDRHASSRQVFRHLAALEAAVGQHGPKALGRLPTPVLEQALEQLEGLVRDWSVPALAFMRSAVSVEITARRKVSAAREQELSVFVSPTRLHVNEDSESAFMEFQRHWAAANNEASGRPRRAA